MSKPKNPLCVRWPENLQRAAKHYAAQNEASEEWIAGKVELDLILPECRSGGHGRVA